MAPREMSIPTLHEQIFVFGYCHIITIIQINVVGYSYVVLESISFSNTFFSCNVKSFSANLIYLTEIALELTGASHGDMKSRGSSLNILNMSLRLTYTLYTYMWLEITFV